LRWRGRDGDVNQDGDIEGGAGRGRGREIECLGEVWEKEVMKGREVKGKG
jgi:hypothetical protein